MSTAKIKNVDMLVVGSGAAGMSAAITAKLEGLDTLLIEKADAYGGSTALSGGVIWIPNNHLMPDANVSDSDVEAFQYLDEVVSNDVSRYKIQTYIEKSQEMLKYFEKNTLVQYEAAPVYPDYYPNIKGAKNGARSLDPIPFTRRKLGKALSEQMKKTPGEEDFAFYLTAKEAHHFFSFTPLSPLVVLKAMVRYWLDIPFRLKGAPDNRLTLGKALTGRLRKTIENQNTPFWLSSPLEKLQQQDDGCWLATIDKDGERVLVKTKAVVFASGGFEKNQDMREEHLPSPSNAAWSAANTHSAGDGINIADSINAKIENMNYVWWTPTFVLPDGRVEAMIVNRSMPGCMIVNSRGMRFCNEAEPYEDFVKHQYQNHDDGNDAIPAWFIFDYRYRREYPIGSFMDPAKFAAGDKKYKDFFDSGFICKANTIKELAQTCGIDPDGLENTVAKMAEFSDTGIDTDFGRGNQIIDRYYSDHRLKNNPCLAPIKDAPFYAIRVWPGDLGTKGGIATDEQARVLDTSDQVIQGLYACGNASSAVMGDSYPAAGSTLGPALTFGYIAAQHAAESTNGADAATVAPIAAGLERVE